MNVHGRIAISNIFFACDLKMIHVRCWNMFRTAWILDILWCVPSSMHIYYYDTILKCPMIRWDITRFSPPVAMPVAKCRPQEPSCISYVKTSSPCSHHIPVSFAAPDIDPIHISYICIYIYIIYIYIYIHIRIICVYIYIYI